MRMAVGSWTTCHHRSNSICQLQVPSYFEQRKPCACRAFHLIGQENIEHRESTAPTAPMGTECLLLTHETDPTDAYVRFADACKRHLSSGLYFSLLGLFITAAVFTI